MRRRMLALASATASNRRAVKRGPVMSEGQAKDGASQERIAVWGTIAHEIVKPGHPGSIIANGKGCSTMNT